eukprot:gene17015-biopygen9955
MTVFPFLHVTKRHPSAILLLVQLTGMLIYPFIESTPGGLIIFNAFGILVLGFTIRMVRRTPGHAWISGTLAVPIIALLVLQSVFDMAYLLPWSSALEAAFYFYAAFSLIAYMMEDFLATTDELFAAGATFTLLAWGENLAVPLCAFLRMQLLLMAAQHLAGGLDQGVEGRHIERLGVLLVAPHGPGPHQGGLGGAIQMHGNSPAVVVCVLDHAGCPLPVAPQAVLVNGFVGVKGHGGGAAGTSVIERAEAVDTVRTVTTAMEADLESQIRSWRSVSRTRLCRDGRAHARRAAAVCAGS